MTNVRTEETPALLKQNSRGGFLCVAVVRQSLCDPGALCRGTDLETGRDRKGQGSGEFIPDPEERWCEHFLTQMWNSPRLYPDGCGGSIARGKMAAQVKTHPQAEELSAQVKLLGVCI